MNIEQAGDVIDRNLLPHVSKRLKRGLIKGDGDAELAELMDRLVANLRTAASLFMTDDARVARQLAEEKVTFRRAEREAVAAHFDVMRADRAEQGMQSAHPPRSAARHEADQFADRRRRRLSGARPRRRIAADAAGGAELSAAQNRLICPSSTAAA